MVCVGECVGEQNTLWPGGRREKRIDLGSHPLLKSTLSETDSALKRGGEKEKEGGVEGGRKGGREKESISLGCSTSHGDTPGPKSLVCSLWRHSFIEPTAASFTGHLQTQSWCVWASPTCCLSWLSKILMEHIFFLCTPVEGHARCSLSLWTKLLRTSSYRFSL